MKTIWPYPMNGQFKEAESSSSRFDGTNVRGRPSRTWLDDISDWGGEDVNTLVRKAQDRPLWETTIKKSHEKSTIEECGRH